jgi:ABC-type branched-subunit amino acid transport system substrate-binding protein
LYINFIQRGTLIERFMVCLISVFFMLGLLVRNVSAVDTVRAGIVLPLTGDYAKFGEIEKNSFGLAFDEINASGGINGKLEAVWPSDHATKTVVYPANWIKTWDY